MPPDALLAGLYGAVTAAGITLVIAYAAGYGRAATDSPPARWRAWLGHRRTRPRQLLTALAAGLITFALTGLPVAAIAAAAGAVTLPRLLSRGSGKARIAKLNALESWSRRLADMLAASRGLEDALIHSAASAPAAIAGPVRVLGDRLGSRGTRTQDALREFANGIDDPVGDLIAGALLGNADRRGPGLRAVLTELADDVAREVQGRREVEADRAKPRSNLAWLTGFMAIYLLFLGLNRAWAAPFATAEGQVVLAAGLGIWAGGFYWYYLLSHSTGLQRFLTTPERS